MKTYTGNENDSLQSLPKNSDEGQKEQRPLGGFTILVRSGLDIGRLGFPED